MTEIQGNYSNPQWLSTVENTLLDQFRKAEEGNGRGRMPEMFKADLERYRENLMSFLAPLQAADPKAFDQAIRLVAGLIASAMFVGATGPLAAAARRYGRDPSRRSSAKGGSNSGKKRREERDTTWLPHAEELASECRGLDQSASQDDVATYIAQHWRLKVPKMSHVTYKLMVADMERTGRLPRRVA